MLSPLISIGYGLHGWIGSIFFLAILISGASAWLLEGALKEPGHDRDQLLRNLERGGSFKALYVAGLTHALDKLDGWIGDAEGSRWRYWSGLAFDRCALLAVVYPLLGIFLTWIWVGEPGVLGDALGLSAGVPAWARLITAAAVLFFGFQMTGSGARFGWRQLLWNWIAPPLAIGAVGTMTLDFPVVGALAVVVVAVVLRDTSSQGGAGALAGTIGIAGAIAFAGVGNIAIIYVSLLVACLVTITFMWLLGFNFIENRYRFGSSLIVAGVALIFVGHGDGILFLALSFMPFMAVMLLSINAKIDDQYGRMWTVLWVCALLLSFAVTYFTVHRQQVTQGIRS